MANRQENRPCSALILAIKQDIHPKEVFMDQIQSATQTHEWRNLIQQTVELEDVKNNKRCKSSYALRK